MGIDRIFLNRNPVRVKDPDRVDHKDPDRVDHE
jgi:hypothetical protein